MNEKTMINGITMSHLNATIADFAHCVKVFSQIFIFFLAMRAAADNGLYLLVLYHNI